MKCETCKDTGIAQNGMYRVVYCACDKGGEEYQRNVLDKPCFRCDGTGRYVNNGGQENFCQLCQAGRDAQYPNSGRGTTTDLY